MRKQSVALGIAALVGVAGFLGVVFLRGSSGVTLNEVLTRIEQVEAYSYQMTLTSAASGNDLQKEGQTVEFRALISPALGVKISSRIEDPNSDSAIVNIKYLPAGQRRMTTLLPGNKQYIELICEADYVDRMRREHDDPTTIVRQLLACEYTRLSPSSIDGVSVEGFQTTDPAYLKGGRGDAVKVSLWVETKTGLPIRMEKTVSLPNDRQLRSTVSHIEWNVVAEAGAFEPVIPPDYKSVGGGPMAMPRADERTALQGLKLLANLGGTFPAHLDLMSLMKEVGRYQKSDTPAAKELRAQKRNMTQEDRRKRMIEIMMPIRGLSEFYRNLRAEDRDPAYFGGKVAPGDKEQVLLRWKVSGGVYKVVYGNLRVETIPIERLAVLEAQASSE
ncbi:MAG: hypothetical protein IIA65_09570 [Planctomycetes bacterium]|nr:hypothetical protein [Planctomycetota bacterium]